MYQETHCKQALNQVKGMPFAWSLNPYRGCTHKCHYCYARASHAHLGLNADEDFETRIMVKTNVVEALRTQLSARSWQRAEVAIGTATDPYQPCEGRYRLMRGILQAMQEYRTPASIVTKSTLVLRDLDLLLALHEVAGARVSFTITTLDEALWRSLEPGTPPPAKRLAVMQRLSEAGIPCALYLAPILPGITDSEPALDAVAAAARAHGASSLWAGPLRLAPLVKEHYLGWVAEEQPELLPRYQRAYPRSDPPRAYKEWLEVRLARVRQRNGFEIDPDLTSQNAIRRRSIDVQQLAFSL